MSDKEWEPSESDLTVIRFMVQAVGAFLFVGIIVLCAAAIVLVVQSPLPPRDGSSPPLLLLVLVAVAAVVAFAGLKAIRLADDK